MGSPMSDHSRIILCNNCVSRTASVQCLDQGLCLCQTCVSIANNATSRFLLCNASNNNISGYSTYPPNLDLLDSFSSSSFIDLDCEYPFVSLPLKNRDSSSGFIQKFDNHANEYLDIPKDSSCAGLNGYETKDIDNIWLNNFDGEFEEVLDLKDYFQGEELIITDQIIDELTKHNANTNHKILSSHNSMSSVIHKDYNNIESLANESFEEYNNKTQIIASKTKEETKNNVDRGTSQLILTDEMLPWKDQTLASVVYTPQARLEAKERYFAKKKKRKFEMQIRYESRKSTANTKRRMKGRFTKAGAEYDYDPCTS
ncbi:unnamed protein product [Cochlearia groenlandica]